MLEILSLIVSILSVIIIPLIVYSFKQYGKIVALETKLEYLAKIDNDIKTLFIKLDDISKELHSFSDKFVSQGNCNFRHSK